MIEKAAEPDAVKAAEDRRQRPGARSLKAAEAEVYKRDIDTATRRRLAGEGKALRDGSYPIETAEDLHNAAVLARSGHGNVAGATRLIARRAKELGVPNPLKGKKEKVAARPLSRRDQVHEVRRLRDDGRQALPGLQEGQEGREQGRCGGEAACPQGTFGPVRNQEEEGHVPRLRGQAEPEARPLPRVRQAAAPRDARRGQEPRLRVPGLRQGPLDKGEKHCPQCGKENPGYLPEADHKIPANKVAKESVAKKRKAKAKPGSDGDDKFGGHRAAPFGAKDDDGDEKPAAKKVTKRKGKGKGRSPAAGVAGHDGDTKPLPAHREPDSPAVEEFEKSSDLEDGDEGQEMAAAMRHKALAPLGLSREDAVLHDLTCPAFSRLSRCPRRSRSPRSTRWTPACGRPRPWKTPPPRRWRRPRARRCCGSMPAP